MSQGPGDVFVFKVNWEDFSPFARVFRNIFPRIQVLYLSRIDIVRQAVSLHRAMASGVWHVTVGESAKHRSSIERKAAKFDLLHILTMLGKIEEERAGWENFFFKNDMQPGRVFYEHFAEHPHKILQMISRRFNFKLDNPISEELGFIKLADDVNEEWVRLVNRYRTGHFFADVRQAHTDYMASIGDLQLL